MIDRAYQGRGLGRQAMEAALDFLRDKPCGPASFVWLGVDPRNRAAIRLYEKLGFQRIRRPEGVMHSTMDHFYLKEL